MVALSSLWLPILLSAVLVFVASSILHLFTRWHAADYAKLPNEATVADALRPLAIPPGDYLIPCPESPKEMSTPAFQERMTKGPVLVMTVRPNGNYGMTMNLINWFLFCLVVGLFAGYLCHAAIASGAAYLTVFRMAGTVAFVGHALAIWPMSIWYSRSLASSLRSSLDGLLYGLLTGGVFGWLWPAA